MTTTALFTPLLGRARWRIVYEDLLRGAAVDQIITYDDIAIAIHSELKQNIQAAVRRAMRELEEVNQHTLANVPNVGYRVARPNEHLTLGHRQQKRSKRALVAGQSKVVNVDMNALTVAEQHQFTIAGMAFGVLLERMRRLDIRQKRTERALGALDERSERTAQEVAELKARLAVLEDK